MNQCGRLTYYDNVRMIPRKFVIYSQNASLSLVYRRKTVEREEARRLFSSSFPLARYIRRCFIKRFDRNRAQSTETRRLVPPRVYGGCKNGLEFCLPPRGPMMERVYVGSSGKNSRISYSPTCASVETRSIPTPWLQCPVNRWIVTLKGALTSNDACII